jgi:pectate lyase
MDHVRKRRNESWAKGFGIALPVSLLFCNLLHAAGFGGFGSGTAGGNNGATTVVSSLADTGPGTLRAALAKGNNQRIVFAVGGTINLNSRLELRGRNFITVDGTTAPAQGITLSGNALYIRNSHDIIISHVRIRNSVGDGILVWDGSYNVVIDHCSVTDSGDENINITEGARKVTISWCIIGDTRADSFARKSKGMLIASFKKGAVTNVSLHHNLFVNQFQRSPQISTPGLFDIRNNVIVHWGAYGIRIRNGARGNIVDNVLSPGTNQLKAVLVTATAGNVFLKGNRVGAASDVNLLSTSAVELEVAPVIVTPVDELEDKLIKEAGALPRDYVDAVLTRKTNSSVSPTSQYGTP